MSSTAEGVAAIREAGGLPKIVRLLSSRGLAAPAVGALQNLSLESQARASIQADPAALPALVALLVGADEQVGGSGIAGWWGKRGGRRRCSFRTRTTWPDLTCMLAALPRLLPLLPRRPQCAPPAHWPT